MTVIGGNCLKIRSPRSLGAWIEITHGAARPTVSPSRPVHAGRGLIRAFALGFVDFLIFNGIILYVEV